MSKTITLNSKIEIANQRRDNKKVYIYMNKLSDSKDISKDIANVFGLLIENQVATPRSQKECYVVTVKKRTVTITVGIKPEKNVLKNNNNNHIDGEMILSEEEDE